MGGDIENNKWHLDKRISVGHLITTVAMVAAASMWLLRLEGRIDLVDQRDAQLNTRIERIDNQRQVRDIEILRRLERIEDKLDAHETRSVTN
jgi:hypothetical protein